VPIIEGIKSLRELRYVLLAGTLLSALAMPQWSIASDNAAAGNADGRIIVAQNQDPKDKNKGKQQQQQQKQKGGQPGGQGPQGNIPQSVPKQVPQQQIQKAYPGQPPGGQGQQKQFGNQGNQPQGTGVPSGRTGQPGSPQQFGNQGNQVPPGTGVPSGGTGQQGSPQQFGNQGNQVPPGPGAPSGRTGQPGSPQPGSPQLKQYGNPQGGTGQTGTGTGATVRTGPNGQPLVGGQPNNPQGGTPQGGQPFSRQTSLPGQGGPQVGTIDQLRSQRQTSTDPNGRTIIQEPGNRLIVRDGGHTFIRADENERFRRFAPNAQTSQRGGETFTSYSRPGGFQVINVTDSNGRLLRRVRRGPDGREVVLIENRRGPGFGTGLAVGLAAGVTAGVLLNLAPPVISIPRERYIVDMDRAPPVLLYETLDAPPLVDIERPYTLDEIRYNVELRDRMRRIDINTITFDSGSWEIAPDQFDRLAAIAEAMQRVLTRRPNEVFLIEGHTDAVGADLDNLTLSDRRAESVAVILTETFRIPPENLVTQGYGEQYLKVQTQEANRINRRVALRRIGPLLAGLRE